MKQIVFETVPAGELTGVTVKSGQLHIVVPDEFDHSEAVFAATWDGQSPFVEVLKGDMSVPKLAFMGWPAEDKATYEARIAEEQVAEPPIKVIP